MSKDKFYMSSNSVAPAFHGEIMTDYDNLTNEADRLMSGLLQQLDSSKDVLIKKRLFHIAELVFDLWFIRTGTLPERTFQQERRRKQDGVRLRAMADVWQ